MAYIKLGGHRQVIGTLDEVLAEGLEDGEGIYELEAVSDYTITEKLRELNRPLSPRETKQVDAQMEMDHYCASTLYGP